MSLAHGSSIVKDSLVSHLDFANSKCYGGTGTDVTDLLVNDNLSEDFSIVGSGHSYSTNNNGYWSSSGNQGNYLQAGTQTFGDFGYGSFTFQFFIRPQTSTSIDNAAYARIAETTNYPDSWYLMAIIHNSGDRYINFSGASWDGTNRELWGVSTSSGSVVLNQWYCLTFIFDRTTSTPYGKIYINDTLSANASLSTNITTNDTATAYMRYPASYAEMQADYGAVLAYKKVLSENEIKQNFEALRGRYGI
jgi:hypothetical protein